MRRSATDTRKHGGSSTGRRARTAAIRPRVEELEGRWMPSTFTVTTNADDGAGSLRQAILDANTQAGADIIAFAIDSGAQTIDLLSALPEVTDAVTIDATTQPGFAGTPLVELNGSAAGQAATGLVLSGGNSIVRGLVINRFSGSGIEIKDAGGDVVAGNYIGTDSSGADALGNGLLGIGITGSSGNTIGGLTPADRNVISGNAATGVRIDSGGTENLVEGNFIGVDATGSYALGNGRRGVFVVTSSGNTVGGSAAGAGNVISGNGMEGVRVDGATGTVIAGNYVGTDGAGSHALGNSLAGVAVIGGSDAVVGGTTALARNLISGNVGSGLRVSNGASGVSVEGNFIGTDATGLAALGNALRGVTVADSSGVTIGGSLAGAGNLISGNGWGGIEIQRGSGNTVAGNWVGTDGTGTKALSNGRTGVRITDSSDNTVGGADPGARNIISANLLSGVRIDGDATGNAVLGNYIGTDVTGTAALGNTLRGITVADGAHGNVIGGTAAGAANVISGNGKTGVRFDGTNNNSILGNLIGTDASGEHALGNGLFGIRVALSSGTVIGGATTGAGNVISGNGRGGVRVEFGSSGTLIQGNKIGTDATGTQTLGNAGRGVVISESWDNTVGGTVAGAGNLISANNLSGVRVTGQSASLNVIEGNHIGTQADGSSALGNGGAGVVIAGGAENNLVGGTTASAANTIAFNGNEGVRVIEEGSIGNSILGNSIYSNTGLGIDLNGDGVTIGVSRKHIGANWDIRMAALQSATVTGVATVAVGEVIGAANATYRVEFFANAAADPSGYGEGQTYLGFATVTTDSDGIGLFATTVSPANGWLSATVTDAFGNTSEFSADVVINTALPE